MKNKIVIGGYYGYGSLGDDAVLSVLISEISKKYPDFPITVLCASPSRMKKRYGVSCVHRYDLLSVIKELSSAQLYISGGGSLLQDKTSFRSLDYYCRMIKLAKTLGAKVYAYANGIGPLNRADRALKALNMCDAISVRDNASYEFAEKHGLTAELSADPFLLCTPANENDVNCFLSKRGIYADSFFTVSLRRCKGLKQLNEDQFLHLLLPFIVEGKTPLFISMQDSCDLALCAAMADMTGGYVVTPDDASILLGIQKKAEFAIGMRLHFLLAAICTDTPVIPLSYDCKVDNVLSYIADIKSNDAFSFDAELLRNSPRCISSYPSKRDALNTLAMNDLETIGKLLSVEPSLVEV